MKLTEEEIAAVAKGRRYTAFEVETDEGEKTIVVGSPSRASADRWVDSDRKVSDHRTLVREALLYPTYEEFVAVLDEYPMLLTETLAPEVARLGGMGKARKVRASKR